MRPRIIDPVPMTADERYLAAQKTLTSVIARNTNLSHALAKETAAHSAANAFVDVLWQDLRDANERVTQLEAKQPAQAEGGFYAAMVKDAARIAELEEANALLVKALDWYAQADRREALAG